MDLAQEDTNVYTEKHPDNLFKRTEVLAAVISDEVISFLFAIFLILLVLYPVHEKEEWRKLWPWRMQTIQCCLSEGTY